MSARALRSVGPDELSPAQVDRILSEEYLTVAETAAVLRLSEYRTRELLRRREIAAVRLRGGYRVPRSALAAFLAARMSGAIR